jgi:hypothetical protein
MGGYGSESAALLGLHPRTMGFHLHKKLKYPMRAMSDTCACWGVLGGARGMVRYG